MIVTSVKLLNFRNLDKIQLDVSPQINIFLGRNGQGKTNLLEGLCYLALGRSHRGSGDREIVGFGAEGFHVALEGRAASGAAFRLEASVALDGSKKLKLDGQPLARNSDLVGRLSAVLFNPDEIDLTKGSPDHRRRFLDYTLSVISAEYFRHLVEYRRVLAQKNRLLKERGRDLAAEIEAWDEELAVTGAPLVQARAAVIAPLQGAAAEAYAALDAAGARLSMALESSAGLGQGAGPSAGRGEAEGQSAEPDGESVTDRLRAALRRARDRERALGFAIVGPHRDRLRLRLGGRSLRRYGSQGEMRSAAIALKLAQAELIYQRTSERPVVFLDDIFSELDHGRTEALQRRLHRDHQLFVATARPEDVRAMRGWEGVKAWSVREGRVTQLDGLGEEMERRGAARESDGPGD